MLGHTGRRSCEEVASINDLFNNLQYSCFSNVHSEMQQEMFQYAVSFLMFENHIDLVHHIIVQGEYYIATLSGRKYLMMDINMQDTHIEGCHQ